MKLLIIGHGRHGKDTVSEYLQDNYGMQFKSSSMHCAENAVYPVLKERYGYSSVEECYGDRHQHRSEWYDLISDYCKNDLARIGREIFEVSDIYCGLRNVREFHSIKNNGLFDYCIWVDRSHYLETEPKSSMSLEPWMADYVIDNNGTLEQLYRNIDDLMKNISES
jgi:dephospho-CoA kinase